MGSLIVAGTNVWLVRSLTSGAQDCATTHRPVIAVMPKAKGDPYFVSCRNGAEEAAREIGRGSDLGRAHQPGRGEAERDCRELDYAPGGRDRGGGGESGGHFDRASQGAGAGITC